MKKIIFLFLTCFFLAGNYSNAQWEIMNEGIKENIVKIDFVDDYISWMLDGDGRKLLVTSDFGESWSYIPFPENTYIGNIDFISLSTGWAVGGGDVQGGWINFIWKTTNGGQSWEEQYSSIDIGMSTLFAIDDQNCFAAGGNKIYSTIDGGATWVNVAPGNTEREYNSLWFRDPNCGFAAGIYTGEPAREVILKTTNGGSTWEEKLFSKFQGIYDLQFTDITTGYFITNNDSASFLWRTTDSGENWNIVFQQKSYDWWAPPGIPAYCATNDGAVYAVIADGFGYGVKKTTDGGNSWQENTRLPLIGVDKIYMNRITKKGFILGNVDGIFMLFTGSEEDYNWIIKKHSYPLSDIFFINKDLGFIAGGYIMGFRHGCNSAGGFFKSSDGGKTWEMVYSSEQIRSRAWCPSWFNNYFFVNETTGFLVSPSVYKITESGKSWLISESNIKDSVDFQCNDICFPEQNTGFIAGKYYRDHYGACILSTVDGGENWDFAWQYPDYPNISYNLLTITADNNSSNCWAAGEQGMIVKYTPQTGWVKKDSLTDLPLRKVFFTDENHGWIAGGYYQDWDSTFKYVYLKTTDGGENWKVNENFPYLINDLYFTDNELGWAVGNDSLGKGVILKSTDGGENWTVEMDNLIAPLKSIYIKDNCAWTVGDNGLILRNTNAGVVWVEEEKTNYPTEFLLEQNYPNPFNPVTTIQYSILHKCKVVLKVYDILGNEIKTLVNEEKGQGIYKINFDANDLASGFYLYRLQAGPYIKTRKMILMK